MIDYNWNCKTVDCYIETEGESDVVYNVHWIVTGTSNELDPNQNPYTATNIGTQILNINDITNFIPFDQLTNQDVISWTQNTMGVEMVEQIETNISTQIDALINPVTITLTIEDN